MSGRIPQSFIQDLVARSDLVELIQARVTLKKRGGNYLGLCPFHNEKTPSFTVSSEKQFYYCFGCGAHGNVIGFLIAFDRLEFIEAVQYLAHSLGLEIPEEASTKTKSDSNSDAHYSLLSNVSRYYQQQLRASPPAIHYLKSRGLTGEIAKQFALGFAPAGWENLRSVFTDSQSQQSLQIHGLMIQKDDHRCFDRFRNRIIFPIRDVRGRVIAFGGRTIGDDPPKYLNSPETPLFHKSLELYGLYESLQHHRQLQRLIIVEGYLDVIALHQHGITYTVATMGTATSEKHLQKLLRYTHEIIFCFDGDSAGRSAAWRALTLALPLMRDDISVRFLFLPQEEDPDSFARKKGGPAFEKYLEHAKPLSDVFFEHLHEEIPIRSIDDKAHFAKQALTYLNKMPQGFFHQFMVEQLEKRLAIDVNNIADRTSHDEKRTVPTRLSLEQRILPPAYWAVSVLLQKPSLVTHLDEDLPETEAPGSPLLFKLIALLKKHPTVSTGGLLELWPEDDDRRPIVDLAARLLPLNDEEGLIAELKGALKRLREQADKKAAEALIQKGKSAELSPEEKKELQTLLTKSSDAPI